MKRLISSHWLSGVWIGAVIGGLWGLLSAVHYNERLGERAGRNESTLRGYLERSG